MNLRKKFFFCGLLLLLSAGFAEILLRFIWHNPFREEGPTRVLELPLHHPGADYWVDRNLGSPGVHPRWSRLRIDERSYILPSLRFRDPDFTIAFLGGSVTEAAFVLESKRFHALLSSYWERDGLHVNILNAGIAGNTSQDSLTNLLYHVSRDKPQFAVFMHAVNDLGVLSRDGGYRSRLPTPVTIFPVLEWSFQPLTRISFLFGLGRTLLISGRRWILNEPPVRLRHPSAAPFQTRLRAFVGLCRALDIQPVLVTAPLTEQARNFFWWADTQDQRSFNQAIRDTAKQTKTQLLDWALYVRSIPHWAEPNTLFYDGMHLNDHGSEVYAKFLYQELNPLVARHEGAS